MLFFFVSISILFYMFSYSYTKDRPLHEYYNVEDIINETILQKQLDMNEEELEMNAKSHPHLK